MTSTRGRRSAKPLLALLIFSPLVYSMDGDPYRAFEVVFVALVFLAVGSPGALALRHWVGSGVGWVLPVLLLILVQPLLVPGLSSFFNLKFALALAACAVPALCIGAAALEPRANEVAFVARSLRRLLAITTVSLLFSAVTGLGEVYAEGGRLQQRTFSWLGDGFAPVMVFLFYYHVLAKRLVGAMLAVACVALLMQAKMAIGMAVFGWLVYVAITGGYLARTLLIGALAAGAVAAPALLTFLSTNLHNFDHSANNRLLSFYAGFGFFLSSPWLGIGVNQSFARLSGSGFEGAEDLIASGIPFYDFYQIHNAFLRTLAEMGIVGSCLLLALCATIVARSYRCVRTMHAEPPGERRSITLACALWLISFILFHQTTGWFEPGNPQLTWMFALLALMNFLGPRVRGRRRPAPTPTTPALPLDTHGAAGSLQTHHGRSTKCFTPSTCGATCTRSSGSCSIGTSRKVPSSTTSDVDRSPSRMCWQAG